MAARSKRTSKITIIRRFNGPDYLYIPREQRLDGSSTLCTCAAQNPRITGLLSVKSLRLPYPFLTPSAHHTLCPSHNLPTTPSELRIPLPPFGVKSDHLLRAWLLGIVPPHTHTHIKHHFLTCSEPMLLGIAPPSPPPLTCSEPVLLGISVSRTRKWTLPRSNE